MAEHPKIRLKGVRKSFGNKVVLDGIDLDIGSAEYVVIIGGSGSGKSVTLKCILGLLRPDAGQIDVDGSPTLNMKGLVRERMLRKFRQ